MNQESMEAIHAARNHLLVLKGMIHYHMTGQRRYQAEKELEQISQSLNMVYVQCLQCDEDTRRES